MHRQHPPFGRGTTALSVVSGLSFPNAVFLITGADSGIGFETALALASTGARVYVGCLASKSGEQACERIQQAYPAATVITAPTGTIG